jgi:hypothetical protein
MGQARRWHSTVPQTAEMYFKSINTAVDRYRVFLGQVRTDSLELTNSDFDPGKETKAAEYSLTDESYAKLLGRLEERTFALTSPDLRNNILNFYADLNLRLKQRGTLVAGKTY